MAISRAQSTVIRPVDSPARRCFFNFRRTECRVKKSGCTSVQLTGNTVQLSSCCSSLCFYYYTLPGCWWQFRLINLGKHASCFAEWRAHVTQATPSWLRNKSVHMAIIKLLCAVSVCFINTPRRAHRFIKAAQRQSACYRRVLIVRCEESVSTSLSAFCRFLFRTKFSGVYKSSSDGETC